jgi:erythronate-4-phosphate dehydrogenase
MNPKCCGFLWEDLNKFKYCRKNIFSLNCVLPCLLNMKIIADENIPCVQTAFSQLGNVVCMPGRNMTPKALVDTDILLVRSVTQVNQQLLKNTAVRFVATATSGINHIDVDYLHRHDIQFASALGSNANSVAQYVLAAVCYWSIKRTRPLNTLSMGIIGHGHVGAEVARLCKQFGISCLLNDPPLAAQLNDRKYVDLNTALACDIVSLHVPLTVSGPYATSHLLKCKQIDQLRPGSLLINAARGGVVHEQALLSRKLKNADIDFVVDVWEGEPQINMDLMQQALIATAHIAGYSMDGKIRGTEMIYQACCDYFGVMRHWSAADYDYDGNQAHKLSVSGFNDLREAMLDAYDLAADDHLLRMIKTKAPGTRHQYFDGLRKNYAIRREWN